MTERMKHLEEIVLQTRDDNLQYPPDQRSVAAENFERNMKRIIQACRYHGVDFIPLTVISNESDFYPFKSVFQKIHDKTY